MSEFGTMSINTSSGSGFDNLTFYVFEVFTGEHKARTKGSISVNLIGANSQTGVFPLGSVEDRKKCFRKGSIDIFYIVAPRVLGLRKIQIFCNGKSSHSWYLEKLVVKCEGKSYLCAFKGWIAQEQICDLPFVSDSWVPYANGRIALGPVLKYRGLRLQAEQQFWMISAVLLTQGVSRMEPILYSTSLLEGQTFQSQRPICYYENGDWRMWRMDFEVPLDQTRPQQVKYVVPGGRQFYFEVPASVDKPKILFGSCLERAHPFNLKSLADKLVGWEYVKEQHVNTKFNLLVLGGDQVYADQVFSGCKDIRRWLLMDADQKWSYPFTEPMRQQAECFYFNLYWYHWGQTGAGQAFSSIPTIDIWDDHDIFDGWGSLNPIVNDSSVYQGLFPIAKKYFFLFQMSGDLTPVINEQSVHGPFNMGIQLTGNTYMLLLDTRAERKMFSHDAGQILSKKSWDVVNYWLNQLERNSPEQLFVVATTPLIYPHSNWADKLMDIVDSSNLDDSRDHWPAIIHREELELLTIRLYNLIRICGCHVAVLSGDVHQGAYGTFRVQKTGKVFMQQFISSGVAASPPPKMAQIAFQRLFKTKFNLNNGVRMQMEKLPGGSMFLATQNFLCLTPYVPVQEHNMTHTHEHKHLHDQNRSLYQATFIGVPIHKNIEPLVEPFPSAIVLKIPVV